VALSPTYRIFVLNFAKSYVFSCLSEVDNIQKKIFTVPFLNYKRLLLRVLLGGHTVALVTYYITKIIKTHSPMIMQFFDTIISAPSGKDWL